MNPAEKFANEIIENCQVSGLSLELEPVKNPRSSFRSRDPDFRIFVAAQDPSHRLEGNWSRKPHIEIFPYGMDEAYAVFQVRGTTTAQIRSVSTVKKRLEAILSTADTKRREKLTLATVEEDVREELLALGIQPGLSFYIDKTSGTDPAIFNCRVTLHIPNGNRAVFDYDTQKTPKLTIIRANGPTFSAPQAIRDEREHQAEQEYLAASLEIIKGIKGITP